MHSNAYEGYNNNHILYNRSGRVVRVPNSNAEVAGLSPALTAKLEMFLRWILVQLLGKYPTGTMG